MVTFAPSDLKMLSQVSAASGKACVSIYLPTHRGGSETRQDPIRLKNLTQRAIATLRAQATSSRAETAAADPFPPEAAASGLQPMLDLIDQYDYWQHQDRGLALFAGPDFFSSYQLPYPVEELCVVQQKLHLLPLLPLLMENETYYILAVSQNQVRLFQASRYEIHPVSLGETPTSLAEALRYDDPERTLQQHTAGDDSIFHGQGANEAHHNSDLARFFRKVDQGLRDVLAEQSFPLVFVGVESLFPIYQSVNSYENLLEQPVPGNPDVADAEWLHCHSWTVVEPLLEQSRQEAIAQYALSKTADKATADLSYLVPAALNGQIDTLLVRANMHLWGRYEKLSPTQTRVELHKQQQTGDQDLLNLAATATALNQGKVHVLDAAQMPEGEAIAAILRYPRVPAMAAERVGVA